MINQHVVFGRGWVFFLCLVRAHEDVIKARKKRRDESSFYSAKTKKNIKDQGPEFSDFMPHQRIYLKLLFIFMCANESLVNSQKRIAGKRRERRLDKYFIFLFYGIHKMRNCGVGFFPPSQLFLMAQRLTTPSMFVTKNNTHFLGK